MFWPKEIGARPNDSEVPDHSTSAGILMYLRSAVVPQSSLMAPRMQERLRDITIKHRKDAQSTFKEIFISEKAFFPEPGKNRVYIKTL